MVKIALKRAKYFVKETVRELMGARKGTLTCFLSLNYWMAFWGITGILRGPRKLITNRGHFRNYEAVTKLLCWL
jgi:hypothetical protein